MTDRADIVTRLRDWASTICMVRGDEAPGSKARLALEAAELIETLRKVNAEVFATGIKSTRDTAELAIELREVKRERDEARCDACELWADAQFDGVGAVPADYAKRRGWDCFATIQDRWTVRASSPEIPDNCPSQERVRDSYKNGGAT